MATNNLNIIKIYHETGSVADNVKENEVIKWYRLFNK
jgi:hypothetical protein